MYKQRIYIMSIALLVVVAARSSGRDWLALSLAGYTDYTWHTGQEDTLLWGADVTAVVSSGRYAPFWLQSNRNGIIASQPYSGNLGAYIGKRRTTPHRWMDYDFGVEWQAGVYTGGGNLLVRQLYVSARLLVLDIHVGVRPDGYGYFCADPELTSGGLLFSDNALPMPRVFVGIHDYVPFPFLFGYAEVKGGLSHMWLADNVYVRDAYVHHKYAGLRLGGSLPVRIGYEFHHVAQWGGVSPVYGQLGSGWNDFLNAFFVRAGGTMANDQLNAQGNHIGSQVLTADVRVAGWTLTAYWQTVSEDGPIRFLWKAMNAPDGLWGAALHTPWPYISGVLYEYLHTTQQSGPFHDRDGVVYGGNDGYFTNTIYRNGWNFACRTIGTPLITSPLYVEGATQSTNNRVVAHHIGVKGDIYGYRYRLLGTYARNYGTWFEPSESGNTALMLEVKKRFERAWGLDFGITLGMDIGNQFDNSFGALFSVSKRGIITAWTAQKGGRK